MKSISQLRKDLVSGDWVVIATGRARRPHDFLQQKKKARYSQPKASCPFESEHPEALSTYATAASARGKRSWVQVIPNKYPAVGKGACPVFYRTGPYEWTEGVGAHEVVLSGDHKRSLAQMTLEEAELVVRAYQERFRALRDNPCVEYISIFHNHGSLAGATITHPHSQIVAIPVVPPHVNASLQGSQRYFRAHHRCVHCTMLNLELAKRERLIYQNKSFAVFTPFASKTAFEIHIIPRNHSAFFEDIDEGERKDLADALHISLAKLFKGLKDPDYNFFLHTAPAKHRNRVDHYHWHFEILPKTAIWAGFEIGTGIEISTITPEAAAMFLKRIAV